MSPSAIALISVFGFIAALMLLAVWQTRRIDITNIEYQSPIVPPALDGFTIVQVSDLHNRRFGNGLTELLDLVRAQQPDLIAVTGDLIDRNYTDIETAMEIIRLALDIAPVYFVSGNHEHRSGQFDALLPRLTEAGVRVLEDASAIVEKNGARFILAGLRDPAYTTDSSRRTDAATLAERGETLRRLLPAEDALCVLLSHRPEFLSLYADCGVPLVLTGHAHGGQVRLFGQGVYAPGQGLFPRYTSGLHRRGNTAMIVSRGLGGREVRLRLCNRPELVVMTLRYQPAVSA